MYRLLEKFPANDLYLVSSHVFAGLLKAQGVRIRMDGRGV